MARKTVHLFMAGLGKGVPVSDHPDSCPIVRFLDAQGIECTVTAREVRFTYAGRDHCARSLYEARRALGYV